MQPADDAQPLATLPCNNRPMIVLSHVLFALMLVPVAGLIGAAVSSLLGAVATIASSFVVVGSAVQRWRSRVELHADHLAYGRGSRMVRVPFADIERVDVALYDPRTNLTNDALATLRIGMKGAAPLVIENRKVALLAPFVDALVASSADRFGAEMSRGDEVRFADQPRFPLLIVTGLAVLSLCALAGLAAALESGVGAVDVVRALRGIVLFGVLIAAMVVPAVRTWWGARRSRGVALSSQGLRPLADNELAARASRIADPFRGAGGEMAGWIPWSAVRMVERDGFGLRVFLHSRPDPVVLSAATANLPVIQELVRRYAPQLQAPAPWVTGVRVPGEEAPAVVPFGAPSEAWTDEERARRREG